MSSALSSASLAAVAEARSSQCRRRTLRSRSRSAAARWVATTDEPPVVESMAMPIRI